MNDEIDWNKEDKDRKVNRNFLTRLINASGMVAWHYSDRGGAEAKYRLLHPFTWLFVLVMVPTVIILDGWHEFRKGFKYIKEEFTWW